MIPESANLVQESQTIIEIPPYRGGLAAICSVLAPKTVWMSFEVDSVLCFGPQPVHQIGQETIGRFVAFPLAPAKGAIAATVFPSVVAAVPLVTAFPRYEG